MLHSCRFSPTCSQYAEEVLLRFGVLRGLWCTVHRILRCHPLARGGYDPVAPPAQARGGGTPAPRRVQGHEPNVVQGPHRLAHGGTGARVS